MKNYETSKYFILYLDILGYQQKMKSISNNNIEITNYLNQIMEIVNDCYAKEKKGITKVKVFSDNIVIVAKKVQDELVNAEKIEKLCKIAARMQEMFLRKYGILFRGSLSEGDIYIDDKLIFGQGIIDAYLLEDVCALFPRVIIHEKLYNNLYIKNSEHTIIKDKKWDEYYFINFMSFYHPDINGEGNNRKYNYIALINKINELIDDAKNNSKALIKLYWIKQYIDYLISQHMCIYID